MMAPRVPPLRVLLVEDGAMTGALMAELLADLGCGVCPLETTEAGAAAAAARSRPGPKAGARRGVTGCIALIPLLEAPVVRPIARPAILLCGAAVIREREHGTMDHLLTLPLPPIEIASAKVPANGFVILAAAAFSLCAVVRGLLAVPIAGSIALFLRGVALYLSYALAVGLLLATLVKSVPQFGLLFMPVFLPMQMLSGGDTPLASEPRVLQVIMQGVASTHFVSFAEAILFRGAGLGLVYRDYLAVAGLGAVFFLLSVLRFRSSAAVSPA